jgi:cyclopropane-fatty-acyl-phospholipid synthase
MTPHDQEHLLTPGAIRSVADEWVASRTSARATVVDQRLLALLQRALNAKSIRITLWDGTSLYRSPIPPVGTVEVRDRATLLGLLWNRELTFGEAYSAGRLDVHGSLVTILEAIYGLSQPRAQRRLAWLSNWRPNTPARAHDNIHYHYDLGNDFYRIWLDDEMVYTCAYFSDPRMSLEDAQLAKMRHVCRKLRLQPGERVVEAGCGWGALALHMARHHGVSVRAYNISREQIRYARERARTEGLADRVEFVEDDYRAIRDRFDVFVSVGMLEHVGLAQFHTIGEVIHRCLDLRRGRGLLHFIGRNIAYPLNPWIRKRIFPGAYPPTLTQVGSRIFEPWDMSVLDVENLRLHYAKTLAHWLARFEGGVDRVRAAFDEPFVRAWRLYLAGAQVAFTTGWMQLFQVTFARGCSHDIPWVRPGVSSP